MKTKTIFISLVILLCLCPAMQALAETPPQGIMDGAPFTNGEIVVNGILLDAPTPYVYGHEGVVMVPLRAIAEALGLSVNWGEAEQMIDVGDMLCLWIGKDYYASPDGTHIPFGPPPEIYDSRTYVPISLFGNALKGYDAQIAEGQVIVVSL